MYVCVYIYTCMDIFVYVYVCFGLSGCASRGGLMLGQTTQSFLVAGMGIALRYTCMCVCLCVYIYVYVCMGSINAGSDNTIICGGWDGHSLEVCMYVCLFVCIHICMYVWGGLMLGQTTQSFVVAGMGVA